MKRCQKCRNQYEDRLVNEMSIDPPEVRVKLCGVCALNAMRKAHGNRSLVFHPGSMADAIYMETVRVNKNRGTKR